MSIVIEAAQNIFIYIFYILNYFFIISNVLCINKSNTLISHIFYQFLINYYYLLKFTLFQYIILNNY